MNGRKVEDRNKFLLRDGDCISLSLGEFAVTLLYLSTTSAGEGGEN